MSYTVDLTEAIYFTVFGTVIQTIVPSAEAIRGQENRVPSPLGPEFIVMTPLQRDLIELPTVTWDQTATAPASINMATPQKVMTQLDIHGPGSADSASILAAVFRSGQGYDLFRDTCQNLLAGPNPPATGVLVIEPLYSDEPRQVPFMTGADQYEDRWLVEVAVQANINITITQDFANVLALGLINVDARYPP